MERVSFHHISYKHEKRNLNLIISFQYEQIDDEHKGLFNGIFDCINDNNAANLKILLDRVDEHFKAEEVIMEKANYSDIAAHKDIHKGFVSKLGGLTAPLDQASVDFAKEW